MSNENGQEQENIRRDLMGSFLAIAGLLLALAIYGEKNRILGIVGGSLSYFFHGLFGTLAVVMPPLLFLAAFFYFTNSEKIIRKKVFIGVLAVFLMLTAIFALFSFPQDKFNELYAKAPNTSFAGFKVIWVLWRQATEPFAVVAGSYLSGGMVGGLLAFPMQYLLGTAGAVIVFLAVILITAIYAFNFSPSAVFEGLSDRFRQRQKQREIENQERKETYTAESQESEAPFLNSAKEQLQTSTELAKGTGSATPDAYSYTESGTDATTQDFTDDLPALVTDQSVRESVKKFFASGDDGTTDTSTQNSPDLSAKTAAKSATSKAAARPDENMPLGFNGEASSVLAAGAEEANAAIEGTTISEGGFLIPPKQRGNFTCYTVSNDDIQRVYENIAENQPTSAFAASREVDNSENTLNGDFAAGLSEDPEAADKPVPENAASALTFDQDAMTERQKKIRHNESAPEAAAFNAGDIVKNKESVQLESSTDRDFWQDRSAGSAGKDKDNTVKNSAKSQTHTSSEYKTPPFQLLKEDKHSKKSAEEIAEIRARGLKLEKTLQSFGIDAKVINYTTGPTITRYELAPGPGVKVSKITNLADDIALSLAAVGVRIEAPIPGKSVIGIEIPNRSTEPVLLRSLLESDEFQKHQSPMAAALGRDAGGGIIICDIAKMPHLLIAGATGSGKSVCINAILMSLLYRATPDKLRILMIDPKIVELNVYNGIPHLLQPVVTDASKAYGVLNWAVEEMERRYLLFARHMVRDMTNYNSMVRKNLAENVGAGSKKEDIVYEEQLPHILIVIDELADLMATTAHQVENAISRLMAKARAAGIHVIIATQRPSVDVITGVIKANIPSRIAFSVASQVDSRTILDTSGAEKLLGKGDMLYFPQSAAKAIRGQGAFVSDLEVENVLSYIKRNYAPNYDESVADALENPENESADSKNSDGNSAEDEDELLPEALKTVINTGYASVSLLQRRLTIGYPRAARLIDRLHELGYIGAFEGSKPRKLLLSEEEYEQVLQKFEKRNEM